MFLPRRLRLWLFDRLSVKTMRYVTAVPTRKATGYVREIYDQIERDFFINGSLTSRSSVPELLASIWVAGRETILVSDHVDRTSKEAIVAVISDVNDCPYCGDLLVSLVHAGKEHNTANAVFQNRLDTISDPLARARLEWVQAVSTPGTEDIPPMPFTEQELPEVLGSMMAMADINRFSHVVMAGSPVNAGTFQGAALRMFGTELRSTKVRENEPGASLSLLPKAELPDDMRWAAPNPRIADALARWAATVRRVATDAVPAPVRELVEARLEAWNGERMPISLAWVEPEVAELDNEEDRALARLALVLAKAPYQVSAPLIDPVVDGDEERFVKRLAWASFTASRRYIANVDARAAAHV